MVGSVSPLPMLRQWRCVRWSGPAQQAGLTVMRPGGSHTCALWTLAGGEASKATICLTLDGVWPCGPVYPGRCPVVSQRPCFPASSVCLWLSGVAPALSPFQCLFGGPRSASGSRRRGHPRPGRAWPLRSGDRWPEVHPCGLCCTCGCVTVCALGPGHGSRESRGGPGMGTTGGITWRAECSFGHSLPHSVLSPVPSPQPHSCSSALLPPHHTLCPGTRTRGHGWLASAKMGN